MLTNTSWARFRIRPVRPVYPPVISCPPAWITVYNRIVSRLLATFLLSRSGVGIQLRRRPQNNVALPPSSDLQQDHEPGDCADNQSGDRHPFMAGMTYFAMPYQEWVH